jgi:spermidine/putrescine transport system permease protein
MTLPALVWQTCFFLMPLVMLVGMTFWTVRNYRLTPDFVLDNWVRMFTRSYFWDGYLHTVQLALTTAVIASILAFPVAYYLAFYAGPARRRLALFLLITPFFTSYLVRIYSWKILLANEGVMNWALGGLGLGPLTVLDTPSGAVIGYLTLVLPLVVLIQTFALTNVDRGLIGAAHNLGCPPIATVFKVTIPAARVGLILGGTFAFILSFGDFVSPRFLGGSNPPTLSILIVDQAKSGNHWPRAAVVAVVMTVTLITFLFTMLALAYGSGGGRRKA